jgi:hypothetical protein
MNPRSIVFVLLVSFGCQQTKESKDITQLRENLPKIETPIKFNSDIRVKYKTVELPDNGLIKKINDRSIFSLLGKVFETEKTITILGYTFNTIGTPVLITLDNEGNEISSHVVFETAKSEPGHHTTNMVSVLPDRQILFTDSTVIRKVNATGTEEITGSDSVVVTHKKYLISETGLVETVE